VCQGDVLQEPGGALVADGEVVAAARLGEGACQEGLAHAGGAEDEYIEMLVDPFALGQLENKTTIQSARRREVKIFHGCL